MKIDYICFTVPDSKRTDFEVFSTDSDMVKSIKKSDAKLFKEATANNMAVVYDRSMHRFTKSNCPIDLRGKTVFYRGNSYFQGHIVKMLENEGAITLQNARDTYVLRDWPAYVQPLHRTIYKTTFGEFAENYEDYRDRMELIYLKSQEPGKSNKILIDFGYKYKFGEEQFYTKPKVELAPEDGIFLTEAFAKIDDPENQEHGREYRVFVAGGEILSIARSFVQEKVEVPLEVEDVARRIIHNNKKNGSFPLTYVVDIAEMMIDEKRVIDVVDYKNPCSAELGVGHNLVRAIQQFEEIEKE